MKKLIIINASNIKEGGALTYLKWFLFNKNSFKQKIKFIIHKETQIKKNKDILIVNESPSRSMAVRDEILNYVNKNNPNLVFTIFGPSYIDFKNKHLMGIGDGWVYFWSFKLLFKVYKKNILKVILKLFEIFYKSLYFKKANYIFCESKYLKFKLIKKKIFPSKKIFLIRNLEINNIKFKKNKKYKKFFKKSYFNILYLTDYREHKNIEYISKLINLLNLKYKKKVRLILTLKNKDFLYLKKKNVLYQANIINIGNINYDDISYIYELSDITVLPSFIETYSSNIVESLKANKIILISNTLQHKKEFKNYFQYLDLNSIEKTSKILNQIISNKLFQKKLLNRQKEYFQTYGINKKKRFQDIFNKLA